MYLQNSTSFEKRTDASNYLLFARSTVRCLTSSKTRVNNSNRYPSPKSPAVAEVNQYGANDG
jgi:hypothetical protein